MATIDDASQVTSEDIELAETSNTILMYNMATKNPSTADDYAGGACTFEVAKPNTSNIVIGTTNYHIKKGLVSIPKHGRMIGLILQEYADGSKRVAIYSQNSFSLFGNSKGMTIEHQIRRQVTYSNVEFESDTIPPSSTGEYFANNPSLDYTYTINAGNQIQTFVQNSLIDGAPFYPTDNEVYLFQNDITTNSTLSNYNECSMAFTQSSNYIQTNNKHFANISNSLSNPTMLVGNPYNTFPFFYDYLVETYGFSKKEDYQGIPNKSEIDEKRKNVAQDFNAFIGSGVDWYYNGSTQQNIDGSTFDFPACEVYSSNQYCGNFEYLNLILTHKPENVIQYLEYGDIPDDIELKSTPTDNNSISGNKDKGSDNENEDGDTKRDMDDTPATPPALSPQAITNNNLYWISTSMVDNFFRWFWNDLGDMTDFRNWLENIQGMFQNLNEAIVSLRYYPIPEIFFGGVVGTDKIILANTHYGESLNIHRINKTTPNIVTIGTYVISEHFNSFCDYAPYTQIRLYLPLFGWLDLDTNLVMGTKLKIQCAFDVLASTLQYYIYANNTLINTVNANIDCEIPFTLQAFNDRQRAIVNNVASVTNGIMGMAQSTKNPIGMANSFLETEQALTNVEGAHLNTYGTAGQTGALYTFPKCVIYIQRPSYNRPKNYGKHIGYPCNKQYTLKDIRGFTQCSNPQIDFTYEDTKPLQSEVDEIYSMLERGVIL